MRYSIQSLAKKPNEYVFLAAWRNPEDNALYFEIGHRREYFRYAKDGYEFVGKTTTVCVYPPPYGKEQTISYDMARKVATAYMSGNCVRIDIDLADRS